MSDDSLAGLIRAGLSARPNNPFPFALYHLDGCGEIIVRIDRLPDVGACVKLATHKGVAFTSGMLAPQVPHECPHCGVELKPKDWRIECVREAPP